MRAYDILAARGVKRLCHFTKLRSLTHIISSDKGILASNCIRQDTKNVTDEDRFDGEMDFVCCTIEYPNSWFLDKAMQKSTGELFNEWVVLYINLSILNCTKAKFCPCNASKDKGKHISDNMEDIESIFATSVGTFRYPRPPRMRTACPTDGQAEILIKNSIPLEYIIGIATGNIDVARRVYAMQRTLNVESIPIFVAPDVITPKWSSIIRKGGSPVEETYSGLEED